MSFEIQTIVMLTIDSFTMMKYQPKTMISINKNVVMIWGNSPKRCDVIARATIHVETWRRHTLPKSILACHKTSENYVQSL